MFNGAILVGAAERTGGEPFFAVDPSTGAKGDVAFHNASTADVADACTLADAAFEGFSTLPPETRAAFLEAVADQIMEIGDLLITTAMSETGLPRGRLEGERGRTVGQLRLFASYVRQGDWLDVTIDKALPERTPLPRSDLRRVNQAVGPVAVFGASNFPLAFSVAGGDTASAFAAGCPVVVKGHPAHPGTGELVARAIAAGKLAEGKFLYSVVMTTDGSMTFASGKAILSDDSQAKLSALAAQLKSDNQNVYLEIQGHTDASGSTKANEQVGMNRANAVRAYLAKQGVPLSRMSSATYGEEAPAADNATRAGRAANRRVVIVVLK